MIIRCTKCSTEFALDPSQVGPEGVTLRCSVCSHMFHAEPDPDATPAPPWKLVTAEKHMFSLPDLRRVVEQVADGRLRPEDQISRTGQTFIKLGELPELSSLFIGAEGLPRVFRAAESSPAGELGPPPAFGGPTDDVRREETVRFAIGGAVGGAIAGGSGLRRPPGDASGAGALPGPPEFDTALPAPPEFAQREEGPLSRRGRAPGVPEPRSFNVPEGRGGRAAPASMLEAVTKAVTGGDRDAPEIEASKIRSQPILVADLARAAAASAEKAVQAVDGQRARERAERSTGTFTGSMSRVDPSRVEPARPDPKTTRTTSGVSQRSGTTPVSSPAVQTAELRLAAAAARAAEQAALAKQAASRGGEQGSEIRPARPDIAEPTQPVQPVDGDEAAAGETGETAELRAPEVVIVKMPEPGGRSSAPLWGLLGVVAAAGIVFGVPSLREKIFNLGGSTQVQKPDPTETKAAAAAEASVQELEQARKAIRNLGFKESNKVQAALQRVIDDPARAPEAVAQARLTQAELVLMRALACKIAVMLEPAAMGGQAQTRSAEDPIAAQELLAAIADDPVALDAWTARIGASLASSGLGKPRYALRIQPATAEHAERLLTALGSAQLGGAMRAAGHDSDRAEGAVRIDQAPDRDPEEDGGVEEEHGSAELHGTASASKVGARYARYAAAACFVFSSSCSARSRIWNRPESRGSPSLGTAAADGEPCASAYQCKSAGAAGTVTPYLGSFRTLLTDSLRIGARSRL